MNHRNLLAAVLVCGAMLMATGCGKSSSTGGAGLGSGSPEQATTEFLEAVRTGDHDKTATMLTPTARERTAKQEMVVAPPGSATAQYAIRDVKYVDEGAHVAVDWSDVEEDGRMHTDRIVWILRKEDIGWRVAGMATKVFPDLPPVVLNFEDPEDMLRQQQWVGQEMARREEKGAAKKVK
jgi:hypothetical protein